MSQKAKMYWAIGIVIAVLVVILLVWNSGVFVKGTTAATVGDEDYSVAELSYYYQSASNSIIQQAQTYAAYGIDMGYDTSLSPSEQYYNEDENVTYADYFLDTALSNLQEISILCAEAEAAGYTLSDDGQASIDENMNALHLYSVQNNTTDAAYLKMLYGRFMTKSLFEKVVSDAVLADDYASAKAQEFTYSDSDLESYYEENADTLDTYEYRYCYISQDAESTTDDDGNTVDPTDEEIAAAMEEASQKADAMIALVQSGTDFNTAAAQYVDESSASSYEEDADYNHNSDVLGSSFATSTYGEWLQDSARQAGDITSIEVSDSGYYVVQFLGRTKGDDRYQTMDYRNILVMAETTESEDGSDALPTDEQLAAAQEQAQAILDQWQAGDATDDSFAALAQENSADEATKDNGGLNEAANRDNLDSDLVDWLFSTDRQVGDASVVPYTDDSGNVVGYEVVLVDSFGDVRWKYQATSTLRSDDYDAWYSQVEENYPASLTDAAQKIPNL